MYLINESNIQFFRCKGYKDLFLQSEVSQETNEVF